MSWFWPPSNKDKESEFSVLTSPMGLRRVQMSPDEREKYQNCPPEHFEIIHKTGPSENVSKLSNIFSGTTPADTGKKDDLETHKDQAEEDSNPDSTGAAKVSDTSPQQGSCLFSFPDDVEPINDSKSVSPAPEDVSETPSSCLFSFPDDVEPINHSSSKTPGTEDVSDTSPSQSSCLFTFPDEVETKPSSDNDSKDSVATDKLPDEAKYEITISDKPINKPADEPTTGEEATVPSAEKPEDAFKLPDEGTENPDSKIKVEDLPGGEDQEKVSFFRLVKDTVVDFVSGTNKSNEDNTLSTERVSSFSKEPTVRKSKSRGCDDPNKVSFFSFVPPGKGS